MPQKNDLPTEARRLSVGFSEGIYNIMKKTAVITGASRGIGRATALAFAKKGYDILVCYRREEASAEEVCKQARAMGVRAVTFQMDMGELSDLRRTVSKALMTFGKIDALVCNAGISLPSLFTQTTEEDYDRLMDVNLKGVFFLSQAAAKEMIAAGGGSITIVSSMWGIAGASGEVAYSASKAALIGMTRALAKELAPSGIRVNCVAPGVIDTDMNACYDEQTLDELAARTPLMRLGTPEDVARAITFLAGEDASFITGQTLSVDGGFIL